MNITRKNVNVGATITKILDAPGKIKKYTIGGAI